MITEEAFEKLVKVCAPMLLRFVRRVGGSGIGCEDVLQECFEALWKNRGLVRPEAAKAFLFTVAHRRIADHFRIFYKQLHLAEALGAEPNYQPQEEIDQREVLDKSLQQLNPLARELIVLRDLEGYSYEEIGHICGLSESQVKVYLFRARKKLKDTIIKLDVSTP